MVKRRISGAAMVWLGAGMVFGSFAALLALRGTVASPVFPLLPVTVVVGVLFLIVGLFQRAGDAANRLAQQRFSWCRACGYPYDQGTEDHQWVVCSECGRHFRAGEERDWLKIHPERVRVDR